MYICTSCGGRKAIKEMGGTGRGASGFLLQTANNGFSSPHLCNGAGLLHHSHSQSDK